MYNEIGCSAKVWKKKRLGSIPIVIINKKVYKYTQKFLKVIIKKKVKHTSYHTCKTIILYSLQGSVSAVFSAVVAFG